MSTALAGRVESALAVVDGPERRALERREADGAGYAAIAEELGVRREQVADLLVSARLRVGEALGEPVPDRVTKACGPSRRVVAAQADGEAVGARDLDRASDHIESCEACQAARIAMQEAHLACRAWRGTEGSVPAVTPAARRSRLAAVGAAVALLLVVLIVALGGGGGADDVVPPAPGAPAVGQGSADAEGEDVVPPPGDRFCLPDERGCP